MFGKGLLRLHTLSFFLSRIFLISQLTITLLMCTWYHSIKQEVVLEFQLPEHFHVIDL